MCSDRLRARLIAINAILLEVDRRRAESGNPDVGWAIERQILDSEMADLEIATALQEAAGRNKPGSTRQ